MATQQSKSDGSLGLNDHYRDNPGTFLFPHHLKGSEGLPKPRFRVFTKFPGWVICACLNSQAENIKTPYERSRPFWIKSEDGKTAHWVHYFLIPCLTNG